MKTKGNEVVTLKQMHTLYHYTPRCATNLPGCACNKKLFMSFLSMIVMLFAVFQDALLDSHVAEDTFSDQELQDTGRPIVSFVPS